MVLRHATAMCISGGGAMSASEGDAEAVSYTHLRAHETSV